MFWPSGDSPGDLAFNNEVPIFQKEIIRNEIIHTINIEFDDNLKLHSLKKYENLANVYCLSTPDKNYLIKITNRDIFLKLQKDLISYAKSNGASVSDIINFGYFIHNDTKYTIIISKFIDGRHYNNSTDDLFIIAKSLKKIHKSLKFYKNKKSILKNAINLSKRLQKVIEKLKLDLHKKNFSIFCENQNWVQKNYDWLDEMANCFSPNFYDNQKAQCLHGEIHPANVIIDKENNPVFIDFEESVHVYAPVEWDLSYLVQRFCLRDNPNPLLLRNRLNAVKRGYGLLPSLSGTMRQISWYCMAMILDLSLNHDIKIPIHEYEKFITLEKQARSLNDIV